jgi:hypothetical protein
MTQIANLEEHFREVKIHFSPGISDEVAGERERLQEEKESTKRCQKHMWVFNNACYTIFGEYIHSDYHWSLAVTIHPMLGIVKGHPRIIINR